MRIKRSAPGVAALFAAGTLNAGCTGLDVNRASVGFSCTITGSLVLALGLGEGGEELAVSGAALLAVGIPLTVPEHRKWREERRRLRP